MSKKKQSGQGKKNPSVSSKVIVIVLVATVLLIVMLASAYYASIGLLVEKAQEFINNLSSNIETYGWKRGLQETFGLELTPVAKMSIYYIDDEIAEALKLQINAMQIDTEVAGLTQVRLRKILIANTVTSSLNNTLVLTPVSEQDILDNLKKKDSEKYNFETIDEFTTYWEEDENGEVTKKSKGDGIWPLTGSTNYTLYYESDVFFYFKDEDKIMPDQDQNQWYLGAMGATTIQMPQHGGTAITLKEYSADEFDLLKTNYESNPTQENEQLLSSAYRFVDSDHIEMYLIAKQYTLYMHETEWGEGEENSDSMLGGLDPVYDITTQTVSLTQDLDTSAYAIPIELMVDLLNITGSGEFLETFIDYAIDKTKVTVNAYVTENVSYTYEKTKKKLDSNFALEVYDTVRGIDAGINNFVLLKDIIFNRQYEGATFEKVTDLPDYRYIDVSPGGDGSVSNLESYLTTAYDPGDEFSISEINVERVVKTTEFNQKWHLMPYEVSTWYGKVTYNPPTIRDEYYLPSGQIDDVLAFANFGDQDIGYVNVMESSDAEEIIERRLIIGNLYYLLSATEESYIAPMDFILLCYSSDIYEQVNNYIKEDEEHDSNYPLIRGLIKLANNDQGIENGESGSEAEYIYLKYKNKSTIKYEPITKTHIQVLDTTNAVRTSDSGAIEQKLLEFLELLQNESGKIPEAPGTEGGFKKDSEDGIVVLYGDIYQGHIPAGDLLLDNGALMLFDLLESTERTQTLVDVFKYLAYLYTDTDYGITSVDELLDVFDMNNVGIGQPEVPGAPGGNGSGGGFYWPVGSITVREENGIRYADGTDIPETWSPAGFPAYSNGEPHGGHDITPSGYSGEIYITACADGVVKIADTGYTQRYGDKSESNNYGYGNLVAIEHSNGMRTYYAHLDQVNVSVGQTVKQGQIIATMGTTGNSSGRHLHFEVRTGADSTTRVQPLDYVSKTNPRPVAVTSGESQTYNYNGRTIKYDSEFASNTTPPTPEMVEKTIISKTTCYDLCYFCCEKLESDPEFGFTASGMRLKGGEKIVAADRRVLPMGTWIYIENVGYYMVSDVGGAIKNNRLDIFVGLPGDEIGDASGGTAANHTAGQTCHNAPASYSRVQTGNNVKVYVLKEEYWPR